MARGNSGRWGRNSIVIRTGSAPPRAGRGYYYAGTKTQLGPGGGGIRHNYYRRLGGPDMSAYTRANATRARAAERAAAAPPPSGSAPAPSNPGTPPGNNDNNNSGGGGPFSPGGREVPKTRESRARRRASLRGRRAQGTRRSLRIGKSLSQQQSRSGVNV